MKRDLLSALFIARKDLRTEFRTKEALNAAVSFALVVLVLFSFAFDLERSELYDISGGLLWIIFLFAGSLIVNRSFTREVPNDCLDVLVASPVPAWALFLGKTISSFTLLMVVEQYAANYQQDQVNDSKGTTDTQPQRTTDGKTKQDNRSATDIFHIADHQGSSIQCP